MLAGLITVDDGTLNAGAPYVLITGAGATMPQRRFGSVRLILPGTNTLWIGGPNVQNDGTNGFPIDSALPVTSIDLDPGDKLYGIAGVSQTLTVRVIYNQT